MPIGPRLPSVSTLRETAEAFGIDLTEHDAATYRDMMRPLLHSLRRIEELPERKLAVRYPRTPGYRPSPVENPLNGRYWRCDIAGAESGVLKGERVALKDVVCVAGVPMMNGSQLLEGYIPDGDATIVTRILDAGGRIIGKTNSEDFSFSAGGHTSALGPVGNPRKPTHNPGASSNGNAVVLVTGQADLAIGGDQGGSIRLPAAWSGVYGLKPTFGLVPYTGCAMIEVTLDHIGPMANTTEGIAKLLTAIAGRDPLDPRQRGNVGEDCAQDYRPALTQGIVGKRIAVVCEGFGQDGRDTGFPPAQDFVDASVRRAIARLESLGAIVEEISIPLHLDGLHIWRGVMAEGSTDAMLKGFGIGSNWQGYYNTGMAQHLGRALKARPNDLPPTVISSMLAGEYLNRNYFRKYYAMSQNLRHLVVEAYDMAF